MQQPSKRTFRFILIGLLVTITTLLLGACLSSAMSTAPANFPTPTVSVALEYIPPSGDTTTGPLIIPVTGGDQETLSAEDAFLQIDAVLDQSTKGSIAYNAPTDMSLNETVTIELLLNPTLSEPALVEQVQEQGEVFSSQIEITPRMKAEILSSDKDAFVIQQIHDKPVQIVSGTNTTSWSWYVTAKKGGTQNLTIVLYRYVKFEGEEYWREVETYRSDIAVKVTLLDKLLALNWYWIAGIFVTAVLIPAFWRWMDLRGKKRKRTSSHHSTSLLGSVSASAGHAFISYRRSDSSDIVGRIYDSLIEDFGEEPIFKDVDDIPLGVDFKEFLDQKVSECTVLLAVIGDRWVNAADAAGKQRLNDPNDFVRIEIESALARDIPVIPLLVRGASMPAAADLPPSLQKLVFKNGLPIRSDPDFHHDMERLISALETYLR